MEKKWTNPWIIFSILLIIVGAAIFLYQSGFFSGPLVLEERTSSLGNKTISILVPRSSKELTPDPVVVSWSKGGKDIPGVMVNLLPQPQYPYSSDCKELKKPIIFVAHIKSLNKDIDICEDPLGLGVSAEYQKEKMLTLGTSGFKNGNNLMDKLYTIQVMVRENYFKTEEGKEKVRQIFESFNISE